MRVYKNIALATVILSATIIIVLGSSYNYLIAPVSKNEELKMITIEQGTSAIQIGKILKANNLIKNEFIFKLYLRMHNVDKLQASTYNLMESMHLKTIVDIINKGEGIDPDSFNITFPEGKNIRQIATIIENNTNNTYEDVLNLIANKEYINSLIDKYWFLTDEIKNKNIYYPLEGYLFPDTYNLPSKDISVAEIFTILLNQTDKVLTKYKKDIEGQEFTVHEFLTFASIVEDEGINDDDRPKIAGVFYNRLNINEPLGSCVTTYYAHKIPRSPQRDLKTSEINTYNPYNTRGPNSDGILRSFLGLPIGPVSNPGEASIRASIKPEKHDFLFFVSDKNRVTYFTKTNAEHEAKKNELISKGLWLFVN